MNQIIHNKSGVQLNDKSAKHKKPLKMSKESLDLGEDANQIIDNNSVSLSASSSEHR